MGYGVWCLFPDWVVEMNENPTIDLKGLNSNEIEQLLPKGLVLLGYRGSIAHGTYIPQDDELSIDDIRIPTYLQINNIFKYL